MLQNYDALYMLKYSFLNIYGVQNAFASANYEMKNIIRHFIVLSMEQGNSKQQIIKNLESFKMFKSYGYLCRFFSTEQKDDFIMNNFMTNTYGNIFAKIELEMKATRCRRILKKVKKKSIKPV